MTVGDHPGVLSTVAGVFGANGVSIRSMQQQGTEGDGDGDGRVAQVAFITHAARERDVQATLQGLKRLDEVSGIESVLRVIDS